VRWIGPIGTMFCVAVAASNEAYLYCGVAVLQFMKECNILLAFVLSCLAGLQEASPLRLIVLLCIVASTVVAVGGDVNFSALGIALQGLSQVAEATKAVLSEVVLRGRDFRLDPLTLTMLTSPICCAALGFCAAMTGGAGLGPALLRCWRPVALSSLLAFVLNIATATMIREVSVVGLFLCGLVKDVSLVILSWLLFDEPITAIQWASFSLTICGVAMWCFLNTFPDSPAVQALARAVCDASLAEKQRADERVPFTGAADLRGGRLAALPWRPQGKGQHRHPGTGAERTCSA